MRGLTNVIIGGVTVISGICIVVLFKKYYKKREPILTMEDINKIIAEKEMSEADLVIDKVSEESFVIDISLEEEPNVEEEEGIMHMRKGTDPNSLSALEQYINLKLADYINEDQEMLLELFKYKFEAHNVADRVLSEAICDDRELFFGPRSRHIHDITWADLIIHYIDKIHFHLGDEPNRMAAYIIGNLDISMGSNEFEIRDTLEEVASHTYINKDTGLFGLFGVDDSGIEQMQVQLEHAVEKKYSFEMEFNAFLGMSIDDNEE